MIRFAAALDRFASACAADRRVNPHSLVVMQHGITLTQQYWAPYTWSDRALVYSVSKTVTGTAVAIAIGEGRLHTDDRVIALLGVDATDVDARVADLTVHHLLSMSTGHDVDPMEDGFSENVPDPVALFCSMPPQRPVGSLHTYNNAASWMLGEIVRRLTGMSLRDYLRPRLFVPLDISPTWDTDDFGRELGYSGLHVTTGDLAKIGQLYLQGGTWDGQQLLPVGWTQLAGRAQIPTDPAASPDWALGYGYQVWRSREGYRLDGAHGQFAFVLPESDAVIALTSADTDTQAMVDLVFEHLVPALNPEASSASASIRLALRTPADSGLDGSWTRSGPVPVSQGLAVGSEQLTAADVADIAVTRGNGRWTLAFTTAGERVELSVPSAPGWHRTTLRTAGVDVPVALAGGTRSAGVRIHLCFTDSPHVLILDVAHAGATQAWESSPLHARGIADLVAS